MCTQLKLSVIPDYKDSRLYENLKFKNGKFVSDSGYNTSKTLVFYNTNKRSEHVEKNAIMRIVFPDFRSAYEYILNNNIKNFNIDYGCYENEIKQYQKETAQ